MPSGGWWVSPRPQDVSHWWRVLWRLLGLGIPWNFKKSHPSWVTKNPHAGWGFAFWNTEKAYAEKWYLRGIKMSNLFKGQQKIRSSRNAFCVVVAFLILKWCEATIWVQNQHRDQVNPLRCSQRSEIVFQEWLLMGCSQCLFFSGAWLGSRDYLVIHPFPKRFAMFI